ncbi:hypothetical protein GCM10009828_073810 [Actinoplanes couchii]
MTNRSRGSAYLDIRPSDGIVPVGFRHLPLTSDAELLLNFGDEFDACWPLRISGC